MLGQCGPRIPLIKSFFGSSKYADDVAALQRARQAEIQLLWQEIGDDKLQKLEELQQKVSSAVNGIYERVLEESMRRKLALEDMVVKSEAQLQEILGSSALQVIASRDLPLKARLNMNVNCLRDVEHTKVEGYGWVEGLLKLYHRIAALREMLRLPPCDNRGLDEVLLRTTEDLHKICPTRVPAATLHMSGNRHKLILQMQHFYHALCAVENVWVHSSATKDSTKVHNIPRSSDTHAYQCLQNDLREMTVRKGNSADASLGCTTKNPSPRRGQRKAGSMHPRLHSDDPRAIEQLSHKILKKLEKLKVAAPPAVGFLAPISPSLWSIGSPSLTCTAQNTQQRSVSVSPSFPHSHTKTPTSVLPERTSMAKVSPNYHGHENRSEILDQCSTTQYSSSESFCESEKLASHTKQSLGESLSSDEPSDLFATSKKPLSTEVTDSLSCGQSHLKSITNTQTAFPVVENVNLPLSDACPIPTQPTQSLSGPSPPPPLPPPPPPPPPPSRGKVTLSNKSTSLKKSPTISRLYLEMKKRMEGASVLSNSMDVMARRSIMVNRSREGMAEALAEITRRSSYFRKIEEDVQKHAKSVLDVKSKLLAFETSNMGDLLRFHASIETQLEQLTDESQVIMVVRMG